MYDRQTDQRQAGRALDGPIVSPETRARRALTRVQHLLGPAGSLDGLDLALLLANLDAFAFADAGQELERRLAAGWLAWLLDDLPLAERWFNAAVEISGQPEPAYWLARVRLLRGEPALPDYEQRLRTWQGAPQATAWFVDLLWRAGQVPRAEQVWKSLRGTARLKACPNRCLLEARWLARQPDLPLAEKLLLDWHPTDGVLQSERWLLLAWVLQGRRLHERAREALQAAGKGGYPRGVLAAWAALLEVPANLFDRLTCRSPSATSWLAAQQARLNGDNPREQFTSLLGSPLLSAHARHALACLGEGDFEAVLASLPGPFLAARCRWRLTLDRLARRQIGPEEVLTTAQQAEGEQLASRSLDALRRLARWWNDRALTAADLWQRAELPEAVEFNLGPALKRLALEGVNRLPAEALLPLLESWANQVSDDPELREALGRRLLLTSLQPSSSASGACERAAALLPGSPWPALAARLAGTDHLALPDTSAPLVQLWQAIERLGRGESVEVPDAPGASALVLALHTYQAARDQDVIGLKALLEAPDWHHFPTGPPGWVFGALASLPLNALPAGHWPRILSRWLQRWPDLDHPDAHALRRRAGAEPDPTDSPPDGVSLVPWCLHQASQAIGRGSARTAHVWVERAMSEQPNLTEAGDQAGAVLAALPELKRRAEAEFLGEVVRLVPDQPPLDPGLLIGLADALRSEPEWQAAGQDLSAARRVLQDLASRPPLPASLARPLGIVYLRAAEAFDQANDATAAEECWSLAWGAWLAWLEIAAGPSRALLLDHLFRLHRRQLGDWLARGQVDRGRRLWEMLFRLSSDNEEVRSFLIDRRERFRDELATTVLAATRSTLEHGHAAEGMRGDYDTALAGLSRLLSLDGENPRLLTAVVEISVDLFLDLYNAQDFAGLSGQVERFTPLALRLARRVEGHPGELASRAALAEFWKFRGFVSSSRDRKRALYQEALAFNPANANVRNLLAELEDRS